LAAGYPLTVWNRTAERTGALGERGATVADSPAAAARGARFVVLMLTDPAALDAVLRGDEGVLAALAPGATVIDCSTVGPADSRRAAERCADVGVAFVDAPVLGSTPAAEQGTLTVLAGGSEVAVLAAEPLLRIFGSRVVRTGEVGSASALKLVMNVLVGGLTELLAEGMLLAERSGVAKEVVRDALFSSVLNSPFLGYKAPQLLERRFTPLFTTGLMLKDLDLALALAADEGLVLPGTAAIREAYAATAAAGRRDDDFSAVIEELDRGGATRASP
ncbi:MAG TPA: NAD(P)-dependent oxidoreductase, partial [Gemmatimonadaceae bacterium]|nr:NAD(P)-dependent oxidoreductase [Gemmatimonadaceae bacterium]